MQQRHNREQQLREEQEMLERQRKAAQDYEDNRKKQRDAQKQILTANNEYLQMERRKRQEYERNYQVEPAASSPGHIGWGYANQRQYIEGQDKFQDQRGQQFHQNVVLPKVQQTLDQLEKERQNEQIQRNRMDAAANYVQQQQYYSRKNYDEELKRQIAETHHYNEAARQNKRTQDADLLARQLASQQQIDAEARMIKQQNTQNYKAELDRQRQMRENFRAYGNMSAAEKAINKDDLFAYKNYDGKNYAMIPGTQNFQQVNQKRLSAKTSSPQNSASKMDGTNTKGYRVQGMDRIAEDESRLKRYSPGAGVGELTTSEQKNFLGGGNLLNGGVQRDAQPSLSPDNFKRQDSLYAGPQGSSLGPGRMLNDGTLDRLKDSQGHTRILSQTPKLTVMQKSMLPGQQPMNNPIEKFVGLKSDPHGANGGIGVTYSNVMLGGVPNPLQQRRNTTSGSIVVPDSTYQANFVRDNEKAPLMPDQINNQTHKQRFQYERRLPVTKDESPSNNLSFVKGVDFNSQDKYDFDILNLNAKQKPMY